MANTLQQLEDSDEEDENLLVDFSALLIQEHTPVFGISNYCNKKSDRLPPNRRPNKVRKF